MGADGHIVICKRVDWDAADLGVEPEDIGLYVGGFLGAECAWGYYGDNLDGGNYYDGSKGSDDFHLRHIARDGDYRETTDAEKDAITRAAQWFENHAESHEVWT